MADGWYWCARHLVWGEGECCWVNGCTDVERGGPVVDEFVYGTNDELGSMVEHAEPGRS